MILLTRIDPARNMARFYVLSLAPTLFGFSSRNGGASARPEPYAPRPTPMPRPLPRRSPARSASSAVAAIPRRERPIDVTGLARAVGVGLAPHG
jgi:hypothetical protein